MKHKTKIIHGGTSSIIRCIAANDNDDHGVPVHIDLLKLNTDNKRIEAEIFAFLFDANLDAANDNGTQK